MGWTVLEGVGKSWGWSLALCHSEISSLVRISLGSFAWTGRGLVNGRRRAEAERLRMLIFMAAPDGCGDQTYVLFRVAGLGLVWVCWDWRGCAWRSAGLPDQMRLRQRTRLADPLCPPFKPGGRLLRDISPRRAGGECCDGLLRRGQALVAEASFEIGGRAEDELSADALTGEEVACQQISKI